jgi:predicted Zn finger-like uncharacterized protein
MKISCQSCQAKYAIADEIVTGKVVKIRCKRCGSAIVVDGTAPPEATPAVVWMVHLHAESEGDHVVEGQQVEMALHDVVAAYEQGRIDDHTHCWKDGMADWLPLGEIDALATAVRGSRAAYEPAHGEPAPPSEPPPWKYSASFGDPPQGATLAGPFSEGPPAALFQNPGEMAGHASRASRPSYPHFHSPEEGPPLNVPPHSRPSGPPSGSMRFGVDGAAVDVPVGGDPRAGDPDRPPIMRTGQPHANTLMGPPSSDLLSRLSGPPSDPSPFALALAGGSDLKMTGERGESSVLFSLAAVKGEVPPAQPSEPAIGENSGMIDMRVLMNAQKPVAPPGGRVDDIMNLSPGGALAGSLAAPVLTAMATPATPATRANFATDEAAGTTNGPVIAGAAVLVIGIVAAAAAGVYATQQDPGPSGAPGPRPTPTQVATPSGAATVSAAPTVSSAPATTPPLAPKFNVEAARAELSKIAATLGTCKKAGGPTGPGKITLTFLNDGTVEAAHFDGKPFAKTPVGECVLARFSAAKVPAFSGGVQPAAKTFAIK